MCFAPQRRALFRHLNFQKSSDTEVFCTFWLRNVLRATTACTFSTSQLPKVVRQCCVLYIFTWKCASRHNGVHFFDISTSKSGPNLVCFVHFDLEICFAPQRRALFRHRNFQKWSEAEVFCTFWLANVLRATTACTFSSLIWQAGSAPAALASLLFDPTEPQIIGKAQCFATFLPFRASASSFFWLFLFSDLISSTLSLLSASTLLCFSSVHIVGSLTSKLPSMNLSLSLSVCLSICLCSLPIYFSMCLGVWLSVYVSMYLSVYLAIYFSSCPSDYLSICLSIDLSIYLSICLSIYLCIYLCVYLSIDLSMYLSICLSIYLSIYLSIHLSISLSIYLSLCLSIYLSMYLSIYPCIDLCI